MVTLILHNYSKEEQEQVKGDKYPYYLFSCQINKYKMREKHYEKHWSNGSIQ